MGRRDAVQFTLELAAEWRRLGAEVTFEPGWERRGNGTSADYEGGSIHHTGMGSGESRQFPCRTVLIHGRPDLSGPLCNSAGPWCPPDRPRIHVIAAHPANHAGASGGRSMGPMPKTSLFNPRSWGHEIDYGGNVAMAPGQYRAALILAKGLANVLRRSTEYVRAHAETSVTGKWDPGFAPGRTIDMARFRADAAALNTEEDFMATMSEGEKAELLNFVRHYSKPLDYRPHPHKAADDFFGHGMTTRKQLNRLLPGVQDDHPHGDVYLELMELLPGREGVHPHGKVYLMLAEIHGRVTAQQGAMDALARLVAEQNGLNIEDVRQVIREEVDARIDEGVQVNVDVSGLTGGS